MVTDAPSILYHGTYPKRIDSIRDKGLLYSLPKEMKNFPYCEDGVYLAATPKAAKSWVEISNAFHYCVLKNIVIFSVETELLDANLLHVDHLSSEDFVYRGDIPFNFLRQK